MKKYRVVKPFIIPGERKTVEGEEIPLSLLDAHRLLEAECVVEVEDRMKRTPQNRSKRDTNSRKRVNSRANKRK